MKLIKLTRGQHALVDDDMCEELIEFTWCAQWSPITKSFYAVRAGRKSDGLLYRKHISMHRVIMDASKGMQVDHIDHNTLDNRRSNLRLCTTAQNAMNRGVSISNTSGYKGVGWDKVNTKWKAYIRVNTKLLHLGYFNSKNDAVRVWNLAARMYHGEFAYTNEIKEIKG